MTRSLLCFLLITVSLSGFAAAEPSDREIKNTIIAYNKALIEAAKDPTFLQNFDDAKKFDPFAEKDVAQKLYIWIKSWHENNLYMDAELLKISFRKQQIEGDKASVATDEIWKYRYFRHIDINKTVEAWQPVKVYYKIEYRLAKKHGTWKIAKIKVLSEKEEKI